MSSDQEQKNQKQEAPRSKIKTRQQIAEESGAAPVRQPTPSSIMMYVLVIVGLFLFWGIFPGYPPLELEAQLATSVFVRLLIVFLLINRSTIGWIIGLVVEGIYIVVFSLQISSQGPAEAAKLWGLLFISIAAMALLMTRQTRQHIFAPDPEITAQQSEDTGEATEDEQETSDQSESSSASRSSSI